MDLIENITLILSSKPDAIYCNVTQISTDFKGNQGLIVVECQDNQSLICEWRLLDIHTQVKILSHVFSIVPKGIQDWQWKG